MLLYLCYVCYFVACAPLVRALVYCNFLKEVSLVRLGTVGPQVPTLGTLLSVCATMQVASATISGFVRHFIRLRSLPCWVACITILGIIQLQKSE